MPDDAYDYAEVIAYLKEQDYNEQEVHTVLEKLREHDRLEATDSLMDSIADGTFDLAGFIQDALGRSE